MSLKIGVSSKGRSEKIRQIVPCVKNYMISFCLAFLIDFWSVLRSRFAPVWPSILLQKSASESFAVFIEGSKKDQMICKIVLKTFVYFFNA